MPGRGEHLQDQAVRGEVVGERGEFGGVAAEPLHLVHGEDDPTVRGVRLDLPRGPQRLLELGADPHPSADLLAEDLVPGDAGLDDGAEPLLRTIAGSPTLIARLRAFEYEAGAALAEDLRNDARFTGDPELAAALLIAAYRTVAVTTAQRRLAGDDLAGSLAAIVGPPRTAHRRIRKKAGEYLPHGQA